MTTGHDPWDDRGEMPDPERNPFYYDPDEDDENAVYCPRCQSPDCAWVGHDLEPGEAPYWKCQTCGYGFDL